MSIKTIHEAVITALRGAPKKVENRRKAVAALHKGLEKFTKKSRPLLRSRDAWFSTTQGDTTAAAGKVRVQTHGIDVGHLSVDSKTKAYIFYPNDQCVCDTKISGNGKTGWAWSNVPSDAKKIREFIEACKTLPKAKENSEREIQWILADALQASPKPAALKGMKPVTWNGLFVELGVSVNEAGKSATGNIDLLVRRRGGKQGGRFLVFEIKKPGFSEIEKALDQAIRYATALSVEANDGDEKNLSRYNRVFDSRGRAKLVIGVVAVLADCEKVREYAPNILQAYWNDRADSRIDRLGLLLYKKEGPQYTWSWLDGWDARPTGKKQRIKG
jgi:hypothetical protein